MQFLHKFGHTDTVNKTLNSLILSIITKEIINTLCLNLR